MKRYYILDLSGNVVDADIDPEALARKLGVLKEGEEWNAKKTRAEKLGRNDNRSGLLIYLPP